MASNPKQPAQPNSGLGFTTPNASQAANAQAPAASPVAAALAGQPSLGAAWIDALRKKYNVPLGSTSLAMQPQAAPAAPAAPTGGGPGWMAAHPGVQFDANGQPIQPKNPHPGADFGSAWKAEGSWLQGPEMAAFNKAYADRNRPLTRADMDAQQPYNVNA